MNTASDVARVVDQLVHADLEDPFALARARLYVVPEDEPDSRVDFLDEDENPYRLLIRTRHHQAVRAGCLVVTGWCAPLDDPADSESEDLRPSEHPRRQRVRVCVAIADGGIATVMRRSSEPELAQHLPDRGTGDLPDVLESWWQGTLR